jgi:peptidoglycan/LPS O-acetylase OafA/YrhL
MPDPEPSQDEVFLTANSVAASGLPIEASCRLAVARLAPGTRGSVGPGAGGAPAGTPTGTQSEPRRFGLIDAIRGIAALTIAAHHICSVGPLPERASELLPRLIDWLWAYGRLAVPVFLVISGFVTALTVGCEPIGPSGLLRFTARRYVRLGLPYLATLLYLVALGALIPSGLSAFPLYDELDWRLALAHVFFLQDILGYPSLSTGIWYLAIEFQFGILFYVLLLFHVSLGRALRLRSPRFDAALLLAVSMPWALMSVFVWNLDPGNDIWVFYHLGPLFLGVACGWSLSGRIPKATFWAYAGALVVGLLVAYRIRLALALATGILLYAAGRFRGMSDRIARPSLRFLGRISYSLFLIHYPTVWAVESLGSRFWGTSAEGAVLGMAVAFVASLAAAVALYRLVERPSSLLAGRLRPKGGPIPGETSTPGRLDGIIPVMSAG